MRSVYGGKKALRKQLIAKAGIKTVARKAPPKKGPALRIHEEHVLLLSLSLPWLALLSLNSLPDDCVCMPNASGFRGMLTRSLTVTALEQLLFGMCICPLVDLGRSIYIARWKELTKSISIFHRSEIREYQKGIDLLIKKLPFQRLAREVAQNLKVCSYICKYTRTVYMLQLC
jgi:hypothetical protein